MMERKRIGTHDNAQSRVAIDNRKDGYPLLSSLMRLTKVIKQTVTPNMAVILAGQR